MSRKLRLLKSTEFIRVDVRGDQRTPTPKIITGTQWNELATSADSSAKAIIELVKDLADMRAAMAQLRESYERERRAGHPGGD